MSLAQARLKLSEEAAEEAKRDAASIHDNIHPAELIAQGLQLEDQQYVHKHK